MPQISGSITTIGLDSVTSTLLMGQWITSCVLVTSWIQAQEAATIHPWEFPWDYQVICTIIRITG